MVSASTYRVQRDVLRSCQRWPACGAGGTGKNIPPGGRQLPLLTRPGERGPLTTAAMAGAGSILAPTTESDRGSTVSGVTTSPSRTCRYGVARADREARRPAHLTNQAVWWADHGRCMLAWGTTGLGVRSSDRRPAGLSRARPPLHFFSPPPLSR